MNDWKGRKLMYGMKEGVNEKKKDTQEWMNEKEGMNKKKGKMINDWKERNQKRG